MKKTVLLSGLILFLCFIVVAFLFLRLPQQQSEQVQKEKGMPHLSVAFTQPGEGPHHLDKEVCQWLSQTQKHVDLAVFEMELPCVEETLITLHRKGKRVRIVTDTDHISPELKALKKAGIPVIDDQRGAFMHNKFLVRDKDGVWTGSMNLTPNGVGRNNNNVIRLKSKAAAKLYRAEFEEMFKGEFGPRSPRQKLPALFKVDGTEVEVLFSPEDPVQERIVDLLKGAQQSIYFMAFSFTDDKMGKTIKERAKAGVEVHGVFEKLGSKSKYSEYGRLKRQKLDVKRDGNKGIMHHKLMVIDKKIVITGSYNFSKNADRSNDENVVVLHSEALAKQYLDEYQRVYTLAK